MALSHLLEAVSRLYHRHREGDLPAWLDVLKDAFELAYFILADRTLAKETALDAVSRLNEERPRRRHRVRNTDYYRDKKAAVSELRKPVLPEHQELDRQIYRFATPRERLKYERSEATRDDLDIWFAKSVVEIAYATKFPAFALAVGLGGALHTYNREQQVPQLWWAVTTQIPITPEPWLSGSEPFERRWRALLAEIAERPHLGLIANGRHDFRRRVLDTHARQVRDACFEHFELRESRQRCLLKSKPAQLTTLLGRRAHTR